MLRHEEPLDQSQQAAQVRVTANELAEAVAAIEARREQEARAADDRIALGDAVQQLDLNVSPEELLAEIAARRSAHQVNFPVVRNRRWKQMARGLGIVTVPALAAVLFAQVFTLQRQIVHLNAKVAALRTPVQAQTQAAQAETASAATTTQPSVKPLSQLTDKDIYWFTDFDSLVALAKGKSPSQIYISHTQDTSTRRGRQWSISKKDGAYYVNACYEIGENDWLTSSNSGGYYDESATIPISRFKNIKQRPKLLHDTQPYDKTEVLYLPENVEHYSE